ncbi:DUF1835 domain-containing protein [Qipengyuania sp. GH1]|uniref:DUF3658 domain-containing protein n=1 Tax=Qipengyuania aestuarii TaxID=2867241 RepID=UPI001C88A443|nr:DUF1835 domain-containing protein [Qipengyuania aestuarii]MBX7536148.1 DUF1835 domain-containing protein [Qipengyuania aestuarii]
MIHVTFSASSGDSLQRALGKSDRDTKVVALPDNLDWGPIVREDFAAREAWFNENLPWERGGWDWIAAGIATFQRELEKSDRHLVWVAPQNAAELCGLQFYLDRFGGERAEFVLVDHGFPGTWEEKPPKALSELDVTAFEFLLANAGREPWDPVRFPRNRWRELCDASKNLRIVGDGGAKSVEAEFFDAKLLAQCAAEWKKSERILADAMIAIWQQEHFVEVDLPFWRLRELALQGKVEVSRKMCFDTRYGPDPLLVRRA